MLHGKNILIAISGGVACYRTADLTRQLIKSGAEVRVIMTRNATRLIRPLLFSSLTGNPVYFRSFRRGDEGQRGRIDWYCRHCPGYARNQASYTKGERS